MQEPIRVAQVVGKVNFGGVDTFVMDIYRNIDRSKVQFDFFMDGMESSPIDEEIISLGGRIFKLPAYTENMS
ncbi:MAG: glycosyltransferase family 1 protein, partial [Oscillospiraceae bacterium]|nr:glycosyltransferase family 1 protein [Oscillospiraceae bacterium]